MMNREHLEHLLRDPNNLFGPPRGEGYDYWRAGTTAAALVLTFFSAFSFFEWVHSEAVLVRVLWSLPAAPFALGGFGFWPLALLGLITAFLVWFGLLRSATWKWHRSGRWFVWAVVGGLGWTGGLLRLMLL